MKNRSLRHRLTTAATWVMALLVLGTVVQITQARAASAADITGAITSVQVRETTTGYYDPFHIDVTWSVPDSAGSGDTFWLDLPSTIKTGIPDFQLLAPAPGNQVVANAHVVGQRVLFTLTSYADTFNAVSGTAFFQTAWDWSLDPAGGNVPVSFPTSGPTFNDSVAVLPRVGLDRSAPRKFGWWMDPTDQGTATPTDAMGWGMESSVGPHASVTFTDNAGAGQTIDCATVWSNYGSNFDGAGNVATQTPVPGANQVVSCTPTSLTVTITNVPADAVAQITFLVSIAPTPLLATYSNSVAVTESTSGTTRNTSADVLRTVGGGTGNGQIADVTIEKYSTALGFPAGDFDAAPGHAVPFDQATSVSMTITNTGTDALENVVVSDATGDAPALTNLTCDFSPLGGPATGVTWAGPFAANDTFDCTGTLPAMGVNETHADTASVNAVGVLTDQPVTDSDLWHAVSTGHPDSVSVGDFVFVDTNGNGVQDAGDTPIPGVRLVLTGPTGQPVTDVFGNSVQPVMTDLSGLYTFDHLPTLTAGQAYTVAIDATSPPLAPYVPTVTGHGTSASDSSTGSATSTGLTNDGDRDPTLDFGFVSRQFDLALRKTLSAGQASVVDPGAKVSFDIKVFNQGNVAATAIVVTDKVPTGLVFGAADNAGWTESNGVIATTIAGPLAPGASTTVTAVFTVGAQPPTTITNVAEISAAVDGAGHTVADVDSTPDTNLTNDVTVDDEIANSGGDEDDNDLAVVTTRPTSPSTNNNGLSGAGVSPRSDTTTTDHLALTGSNPGALVSAGLLLIGFGVWIQRRRRSALS